MGYRESIDEELISKRIKNIRIRKNMTMEELAKRIKMSKAYISQLEKSSKSAPISTLNKIAKALNVDINFLISGKVVGEGRICFKKKEGQMEINNRKQVGANYVTYDLAYGIEGKELITYIVEVGNKQEEVPYSFLGEEFFYVLKGSVEVNVNGKIFEMDEGDSIFYDATLPHYSISTKGNKKSLLLMVVFLYKDKESSTG